MFQLSDVTFHLPPGDDQNVTTCRTAGDSWLALHDKL
jgi:hypothetical protein